MSLQVDQAAAGLLALGLNKGDRLGVWGPNTYEWVLFQFATARAGIILVSQSYSIVYNLDLHILHHQFVLCVHCLCFTLTHLSFSFSSVMISFFSFFHLSGVCEPSIPAAGGGVCIAEGWWHSHTVSTVVTRRETASHQKSWILCCSFPQVGCKAIVCPTQFKTQKYCDMLRQICPEIESSSPGDIKSARYSPWQNTCKCQVWLLVFFLRRPKHIRKWQSKNAQCNVPVSTCPFLEPPYLHLDGCHRKALGSQTNKLVNPHLEVFSLLKSKNIVWKHYWSYICDVWPRRFSYLVCQWINWSTTEGFTKPFWLCVGGTTLREPDLLCVSVSVQQGQPESQLPNVTV